MLRPENDDPHLDLDLREISQELIQRAGGPTQALMAVAFHAGIAIAFRGRKQLEHDYGRKFTDEEWERVQSNLRDFGDMVSPEAVRQWEQRLWRYSALPADPFPVDDLILDDLK